jgi:transcriptional regulator with XRE-family HTH domain
VHHTPKLFPMQLPPFQRALGARVRQMREKEGWSQEEFAHRCGIQRSYMGVVERGEYNFTLKTVYKLAKGLDTSVSKLLKGIL